MPSDKEIPPKAATREPQYRILLDRRDDHGLEPLGLMTNQAWYDDPKRLAFTFARNHLRTSKQDKLSAALACADVVCGKRGAARRIEVLPNR